MTYSRDDFTFFPASHIAEERWELTENPSIYIQRHDGRWYLMSDIDGCDAPQTAMITKSFTEAMNGAFLVSKLKGLTL